MKLASTTFSEGKDIPVKYTCDGENVNPPLLISDVPPKAKSLALIMDDPDIPEFVKQKFGMAVFDHWIMFNIPPSTTSIKEGEASGKQGKNSGGGNKYTGPCPPDGEHRYFFKLYALDAMLNLSEGCTKEDLLKAMKGHTLEEAQLMGTYNRKK